MKSNSSRKDDFSNEPNRNDSALLDEFDERALAAIDEALASPGDSSPGVGSARGSELNDESREKAIAALDQALGRLETLSRQFRAENSPTKAK